MNSCEVGVLGRRVAGVQLLQREQLRVDRGQQAGVERTEQPGPQRGLGGQGGLFARRRTRRRCPGPAGRSRSRWSARRPRSYCPGSWPRGWPGYRRRPSRETTNASATKSTTSELVAALASVRIHLYLTRRPGAEEFAAILLWKAADINKIPGRKYSASRAQFYAISVQCGIYDVWASAQAQPGASCGTCADGGGCGRGAGTRIRSDKRGVTPTRWWPGACWSRPEPPG